MENTGLLLIDLQRDFLQPAGRLPVGTRQAENVIECALRLISFAQTYDAKPIFVVNQFSASDRFRNIFRRHSAITGSSGAEIDPRIVYQGFPCFTKATSDAFSNPKLDIFLRGQGITHLIIVGVYAEGCVLSTVSGAIDRGYQVTIASDGVESNKAWKKRLAFWDIRRRGANIISSRDILNNSTDFYSQTSY
ncbi:MAG: cysteine hydrolase [Dissulfurispiraceae bacterium]